MLALLFSATLQLAVAQESKEVRVERLAFPDELTREYTVRGGFGFQCMFAGYRASICEDPSLTELIRLLDLGGLNRAVTLTFTSICVTKQPGVTWEAYEQWLTLLLDTLVFPGKTIRIVDVGLAPNIPEYHRSAYEKYLNQASP